MSVKELNTLVNLLSDPDTVVFGAVASQLLEQGSKTIPLLEKEWSQNNDTKTRERIENLIQQIHSNEVRQGLQEWLSQPEAERNLLKGAFWIAKQRYHNLQFSQLQDTVNNIMTDIWIGLADEDLPPLNKLNIFNKLFFRGHSFIPTTETLNPTYCFINRVLETKCGNGASLALLYLHIAQQIGLSVEGVCAPGVSLLAYVNDDKEILCYINPYNNGSCCSKNLLTSFFKQSGIEPREEYYSTCSKTTVLLRLLDYLIYAYEQENANSQVEIYRSLRSLFGKTSSFLSANEDESSL